MAERASAIADAAAMLDYVGVAHATLCWASWREGRRLDVERHARIALDAWGKLLPHYAYPLHWLARMPLACHLAESGRIDAALDEWRALLDDRQHRLPVSLTQAIEAALGNPDPDGQRRHLHGVLELCRGYRYL